MDADPEELKSIDGVGPVLADNFTAFFSDAENRRITLDLAARLKFNEVQAANEEQVFKGKIFVITGDLKHFNNRREAHDLIERLGGKATGSVSAKTSYLINNDILSSSSKNKMAKQYGIPIISEDEFISMLPEEVRNV